jgi:hypothetical protein
VSVIAVNPLPRTSKQLSQHELRSPEITAKGY